MNVGDIERLRGRRGELQNAGRWQTAAIDRRSDETDRGFNP